MSTERPNEKTAPVRCPSAGCGVVFDVPERRLGRNVYCLACGVRLTARPVDIEPRLRRRQETHRAGSGADVRRLPLIVLVDNVRSLWNVGSIFRTADACGVRRLMLCGITGCPPRNEISKTALGAEDAVAWSYHADPLEALAAAVDDGCVPVALETASTADCVSDVRWPDPCCLVIGNEVAGVSPALLEACERKVSIPMIGVKDSLNVAVAFGIAAFAAARDLAMREGRSAMRAEGP
ncbi:MAG: RNA methyltransferase [bacterium]|nr:RNA methyltransferase [bacterium]